MTGMGQIRKEPRVHSRTEIEKEGPGTKSDKEPRRKGLNSK